MILERAYVHDQVWMKHFMPIFVKGKSGHSTCRLHKAQWAISIEFMIQLEQAWCFKVAKKPDYEYVIEFFLPYRKDLNDRNFYCNDFKDFLFCFKKKL